MIWKLNQIDYGEFAHMHHFICNLLEDIPVHKLKITQYLDISTLKMNHNYAKS